MDQNKTLFPSIGQAFTLVGVFFFFSLLLQILTLLSIPISQFWLILIIYTISFLLTLTFTYLYSKGVGDAIRLQFKSFNWRLIPLLLVVTPALAIISEALISLLPTSVRFEALMENSVSVGWASMLTVVVAAPILEEIFCRGIILRGLLTRMLPWEAILVSSFIFALLHMNPWQGIAALIIGSLSGYVYWRTQSLWPSILIHIINNGFAYLTLWYFDGDIHVTTDQIFGSYYVLVLLLSIVISGVGLKLIENSEF